MQTILKGVSCASLVLLIAAPVLFYSGRIPLEANKTVLLVATAGWFAATIGWMGRKKNGRNQEMNL